MKLIANKKHVQSSKSLVLFKTGKPSVVKNDVVGAEILHEKNVIVKKL